MWQGLDTVYRKYLTNDYGNCPCCNTALLPMGTSDCPGESKMVLYCASCAASHAAPHDLDSAFFGTALPAMFFLAYPNLIPLKIKSPVPPTISPAVDDKSSSTAAPLATFLAAHNPYPTTLSIFGFKVHHTSPCLPAHVQAYREFAHSLQSPPTGESAPVVSESSKASATAPTVLPAKRKGEAGKGGKGGKGAKAGKAGE